MTFTTSQEFDTIAARVRATPISDQDIQLSLYGLFKQTTIGDTDKPEPWATNKETAKLKAWVLLRGTPREVAQERYISEAKSALGLGVPPKGA